MIRALVGGDPRGRASGNGDAPARICAEPETIGPRGTAWAPTTIGRRNAATAMIVMRIMETPQRPQRVERDLMIRSTTIVAVRRDGKLAMAGDGQVTIDKTVVKHHARKVRKIADGKVLAGFAGSAADGIALLEKFEGKYNEYKDLTRAAVELAKDWRQDRVLRRLEALLLVGTPEHLFLLSGTGDVIEPDEGIAAIGSGGPYAQAAARRSCGTRI